MLQGRTDGRDNICEVKGRDHLEEEDGSGSQDHFIAIQDEKGYLQERAANLENTPDGDNGHQKKPLCWWDSHHAEAS